ncbi:MAG: hypothetical protein IPG32_00255 [Saprospirales bacterium]|nr:hypothetical protein [Saprospirales bacterium]
MTTLADVEHYLAELRTKLDIWGLIFRSDRGKNMQTLLDLELSVNQKLYEKQPHNRKTHEFSAGGTHSPISQRRFPHSLPLLSV